MKKLLLLLMVPLVMLSCKKEDVSGNNQNENVKTLTLQIDTQSKYYGSINYNDGQVKTFNGDVGIIEIVNVNWSKPIDINISSGSYLYSSSGGGTIFIEKEGNYTLKKGEYIIDMKYTSYYKYKQ